MPLFATNWENLGYRNGPISFYLVNSALFGGWQNAMPQEIATDLAQWYDNPLDCTRRETPVRWCLRKVTGDAVTTLATSHRPIEGTATVGAGCVEHMVHWPAIGGTSMPVNTRTRVTPALNNSGTTFFTRGGTVIIYSTWQPCLNCCNSLFTLARDPTTNFNIVVRFQRVYDIDRSGPLADATLVIPRRDLILSAANPAPADRAVFIFHDDVAELRNIRPRDHASCVGEIKPIAHRDTKMHPHHDTSNISTAHPGGAPCGFTGTVARANAVPNGNFSAADCPTCGLQATISPVGSGLPWAVANNSQFCIGYVPGQHYASNRLAV